MAWIFGDGFDLYPNLSDPYVTYWDSGSMSNCSFVAGRFTGSRAVNGGTNGNIFTKSSNVNDAVHHFILSVNQITSLGGTNIWTTLTLLDGLNAQCTIAFRSDGAILLQSGAAGGTTLATYTGAVTSSNVWFAFEFEIVIHNTTGSFTARKNGNPANDFTLGSLNTRAGSTNNYANKLTIGVITSVANQYFDDLLWRSDASSLTWLGDIRCYTRLPSTDVSVQFTKSLAATSTYYSTVFGNTGGPTANQIWWFPVTALYSGSVTALNMSLFSALTGHVNMAAYDATGAAISGGVGNAASGSPGPGALLGTGTPLTNPGTGVQNFTLGTPFNVTKNQTIWLAMIADAALNIQGGNNNFNLTQNFTYSGGAFPATGASAVFGSLHNGCSYLGFTMTIFNAGMVNETLQDGTTTYVYDSTIGHADFYNIAPLAGTPSTVIAVITRGFMEKSDAGFRSGAVQLKSGGITVASAAANLSTSFGWVWRIDTVDPNTSAPWTPVAVNAVQIGPTVIG